MTSIHFQIDPHALRVLHGDRAEGFQQRRERERSRAGEERNAGGQDSEGSEDSPNVNGMRGLSLYNEQMLRERASGNNARRDGGGMRIAGAPAHFVAAGGRRLNLDSMGYEELVEAFPVVAPRGIGRDVLDQCSNVYKFRCNLSRTKSSDTSCSICLATFEDGDEIRMLPCLHPYHKACADQWLANHTTCPVCKTDVKTLVAEIPRITGKGHPNGIAPPRLQRQSAQWNLLQAAAGGRDASREPPRNSAGAPDASHFRSLAQNAIDNMRAGIAGRQQHHSVASIDAVSRDHRLSRREEAAPREPQSRGDAAAVQARRRAFPDAVREQEQRRAEEAERDRMETVREERRREEERERRERERRVSREDRENRSRAEEQRRIEQEAAIALSDEIDVYREIAEQHRRQYGPARRANSDNSMLNRVQSVPNSQPSVPMCASSDVAITRASSDIATGLPSHDRAETRRSPSEQRSGPGIYSSGQRAPALPPVRADQRSNRDRERMAGRSTAAAAAAQIIETSPTAARETTDARQSAAARAAIAMASMRTPARGGRRMEVAHSPQAGSLFTSSPRRRDGNVQERAGRVRFSLEQAAQSNPAAPGGAPVRPSSAGGARINAAVQAARSAPRRDEQGRQMAWAAGSASPNAAQQEEAEDADLQRAIKASIRDAEAAASTQQQQPFFAPSRPPGPSNRQSNARPLPGVEMALRRSPPPEIVEPDSVPRRSAQGVSTGALEDQTQSVVATTSSTEECADGHRLGHAGGQDRVAARAGNRAQAGAGEADQSSSEAGAETSGTPRLARRSLSDREKRALAAERRVAMLAAQRS